MAIDVSSFAADLPAATYAAGDVVTLANVDGPANVRSGRGRAILKRISSFMLSNATTGTTHWRVEVQNSDWIDKAASFAVPMVEATAMDTRSGAIQPGHDCELTPNSSWQVIAVCVSGGTTTTANSITCDIEIDYPQVSAIIDPTTLPGTPTSISMNNAVTINAVGSATTAKWDVYNVDIFKAGFEYALEKIEIQPSTGGVCGFIKLSNAAGMGGLSRIMAIAGARQNIRPVIEYASKLVKGPMDISFKLFAASSGTATVDTTLDFVKRRM